MKNSAKKSVIIIYTYIIVLATRVKVVPQAIEPFNTYVLAVLVYLSANQVRLHISVPDLEAFSDMVTHAVTGWTPLHTKHSAPGGKTTVVNHDLKDKEAEITHFLEVIYREIPRRVMTNDDYLTLHVAKPVIHRASRTPIFNVPFSIMYSPRGHKVHFICRVEEADGKASMDPLADELEVRGVLLNIGDPEPTDPMACPLVFTSTKAIFNHPFSAPDAGKKFCCFIRFKNDTDDSKSGSFSDLLRCLISY